jgi:hypothetical protein
MPSDAYERCYCRRADGDISSPGDFSSAALPIFAVSTYYAADIFRRQPGIITYCRAFAFIFAMPPQISSELIAAIVILKIAFAFFATAISRRYAFERRLILRYFFS